MLLVCRRTSRQTEAFVIVKYPKSYLDMHKSKVPQLTELITSKITVNNLI